jgi:hypothetical protein|tara:strand:- start:633 stop:872 length:240 start_codon:yes stop_codon:yes gene_type:complete
MKHKTQENIRSLRYVVYDPKGKYMSAYNSQSKSFSTKEAFKWAKLTANHCNGVVKVVREDGVEYEVYQGYSKSSSKKSK